MNIKFIYNYFINVENISKLINYEKINKLVKELTKLKKKKGRLFILGVGGSAANASHAVNDFRKICEIEAYAPTDNISELTARTNDEGFETIFESWLKISKLKSNDALLIFSVGGGSKKKKLSINLINAVKYAIKKSIPVYSIVGNRNGYAYKYSTISILIPSVNKKLITPLSESFQSIIWHCIVSDKRLKKNNTKW
jgi:D-sedoheptulose 7-phosphate isomerase